MKIINIPRTLINSNCLRLAYLIYIKSNKYIYSN